MRTLICIPCMDMVQTQFMISLINLKKDDAEIKICANSLVYDSRNQLAQLAVREGFDRILWLDSDMTVPADFLDRLARHLDNGLEMVTGLYFTRRKPARPVIYSDLGYKEEDGQTKAYCTHYSDYPRDSLFEVEACGMGGCMMTTELVDRIGKSFGLPFSPIIGFGEDFSFCLRAKQLGIKIWCDSGAKLGHIGQFEVTEGNYIREREEQGGDVH